MAAAAAAAPAPRRSPGALQGWLRDTKVQVDALETQLRRTPPPSSARDRRSGGGGGAAAAAAAPAAARPKSAIAAVVGGLKKFVGSSKVAPKVQPQRPVSALPSPAGTAPPLGRVGRAPTPSGSRTATPSPASRSNSAALRRAPATAAPVAPSQLRSQSAVPRSGRALVLVVGAAEEEAKPVEKRGKSVAALRQPMLQPRGKMACQRS